MSTPWYPRLPEPTPLDIIVRAVLAREAASGLDALEAWEKVIFLVWTADGEIENGSFFALFYNSTGDHLSMFPEAFAQVGATKKARTLRKLVALFDGHPLIDHERRHDDMQTWSWWRTFRVNRLSARYLASNEDIVPLLNQYLASNGKLVT